VDTKVGHAFVVQLKKGKETSHGYGILAQKPAEYAVLNATKEYWLRVVTPSREL